MSADEFRTTTTLRLRGLWQWWIRELRSCGSAIAFASKWAAVRQFEIRLDGCECALFEKKGGKVSRTRAPVLVSKGSWSEILALAGSGRSGIRATTAIELVLPEGKYLRLDKTLPVEALTRAAEVLDLELERTSPFNRSEVYTAALVTKPLAQGTATTVVSQFVVKRSFLDPLVGDFTEAGLKLNSVSVLDETSRVLPINLIAGTVVRAPTLLGRLNMIVAGFASLTFVLWLVASSASLWRQSVEVNELSRKLEVTKKEALRVRQTLVESDTLLARASGLRIKKIGGPTLLVVWEELTRLLPGTAWLTSFRMEDEGLIYIDGSARASAELISLLAGSRYFTKVEFSSPVTRDPQTGFEQFQIQMKLGSKNTSAASSETPINGLPPI